MVARIGHNWDAAAIQPLIAPIVQTMVVVHNIAGIQSYHEYDELREIRGEPPCGSKKSAPRIYGDKLPGRNGLS